MHWALLPHCESDWQSPKSSVKIWLVKFVLNLESSHHLNNTSSHLPRSLRCTSKHACLSWGHGCSWRSRGKCQRPSKNSLEIVSIRITKGNFTILTLNTDFAAIDAVALEARVALAFVFSGGVLEDAPRVGVARVQVYIARLCTLNILSIQKCVMTQWKFFCLEMR